MLQEQPPETAEGFLKNKKTRKSGGKKTTNRSWKNYYTVISGQSLWFFKDQRDFKDWKPVTATISLYNATCYGLLSFQAGVHNRK